MVRPLLSVLTFSNHPNLHPTTALQGYTSKSASESALNTIIHNILISRSQTALTLAQKIATKRSGQRGHTARQALLAAEAHLASITSQNAQTYITPVLANEVMSEVFGAYEGMDVEADESRAKGILRGLGFKDEELQQEGKQIGWLSGGWRMRVMLGKALFINPDILLLDEPSECFCYLSFLINGIDVRCPL